MVSLELCTSSRGLVEWSVYKVGGIHLEGVRELAYSAHSRTVYFAALQAPDVVPVRANLLRQLLAVRWTSC